MDIVLDYTYAIFRVPPCPCFPSTKNPTYHYIYARWMVRVSLDLERRFRNFSVKQLILHVHALGEATAAQTPRSSRPVDNRSKRSSQ